MAPKPALRHWAWPRVSAQREDGAGASAKSAIGAKSWMAQATEPALEYRLLDS